MIKLYNTQVGYFQVSITIINQFKKKNLMSKVYT